MSLSFPHLNNATERAIIGLAISDTLAAGHMVSVYDGEEWALKKSQKAQEIANEIGASDETQLRIRRTDGSVLGWVLLVHGNGPDVICDYSDNDELNGLLARAIERGDAA